MTDPLSHIARGLKAQPLLAGARSARIGWLEAKVTDAHKREADEMLACPVPVVTIASVGMQGLEKAMQLMSSPLGLPVRAILELTSLDKVTLELQGRERAKGRWVTVCPFTFTPFTKDETNKEQALERVLKYAEVSAYLLVDLVDSGNGVGIRVQFGKAGQKLAQRRFAYERQQITPCIPDMK